jgi:isoaspartyl peptidase/L-asparaginase-like protein (Ntn-hydrolase superfamily)
MLAGNGAIEFARKSGFEEVADPTAHYRLPVGVTRADVNDIAHGTVGAVAVTRDSDIAMPYNSEGMKRARAPSTSKVRVAAFIGDA